MNTHQGRLRLYTICLVVQGSLAAIALISGAVWPVWVSALLVTVCLIVAGLLIREYRMSP